MRQFEWRWTVLAAVSVAWAMTPTAQAVQVIYRQTFGDNAGVQASLSTVNWAVAAKSAGTDVTKASEQDAAISNLEGSPNNVPNVDTKVTTASQQYGLVFVSAGATITASDPVLFYTNEFTLFRSGGGSVTDFSFQLGNGSASDPVRVAIEIAASDGNHWYLSNTNFTMASLGGTGISGGNFPTQSKTATLAFTTTAADWTNLNFTAGSQLGVGTGLTSSLPDGSIIAYGLYSPGGRTNNVRFDTFTVDGTLPEPASLGFLVIAPGILLRRRRNSVAH